MEKWINYHHLFYFMTIAEMGSISRAARKLLLGQPTLSAQLKQLEESLGVQLFERQHKKLILTEHGQVALEYARNIFSMGGEMYEALHDRLKPSRVSVQLGAQNCIPKQVLHALVESASKAFDCTVTVIEGKFDELVRELTAHRMDLIITNTFPRTEATKGLHHRTLSRSSVSIYGSPNFTHLKKDFPRSIEGIPVVLPTYDSQLRYDLEHWFKVNELDVEVSVETQDIALKKVIAVNGNALIPAAAHTVSRQLANGELVHIGPLKAVTEELFLISSERKIANPVASHLMKVFKLVTT